MAVVYFISMVSISVYYVYITIIKSANDVYIEKRSNSDQPLYYAVIIPCFNEEKVIKQTLLSLLRFTEPNLMVYVVDDDSSDNTLNVINGISDPRIKVIRKRNPMLKKARDIPLILRTKVFLKTTGLSILTRS